MRPFQTLRAKILDLGANIGMASVFFALKYPLATIYAYEPDPITSKYLTENVRGLNVHCYQEAIYTKRGTTTFYHSPSLSLASSLRDPMVKSRWW